jgi:hypothetical protein
MSCPPQPNQNVLAFSTMHTDGAMLRTTLIKMGHPQPPTPVQTDNATASGISNGTVRQRKSKAMDMRFYWHWVQDRVRQGQFNVYWQPGWTNLGNYFTKHHLTTHHRAIRLTYLHIAQRANAAQANKPSASRFLQECVDSTPGYSLRVPMKRTPTAIHGGRRLLAY